MEPGSFQEKGKKRDRENVCACVITKEMSGVIFIDLPTLDYDALKAIEVAADYITDVLEAIKTVQNGEYDPETYDPIGNPFETAPGRIPKIDLRDYVERILKYAARKPSLRTPSPAYVKHLCKYTSYMMDLLLHRTTGLVRVTNTSVYRLFAVTFMCYEKFWDDTYWTSKYYAKVFGFGVDQLNVLEIKYMILSGYVIPIEIDDNYVETRFNVCMPEGLYM